MEWWDEDNSSSYVTKCTWNTEAKPGLGYRFWNTLTKRVFFKSYGVFHTCRCIKGDSAQIRAFGQIEERREDSIWRRLKRSHRNREKKSKHGRCHWSHGKESFKEVQRPQRKQIRWELKMNNYLF